MEKKRRRKIEEKIVAQAWFFFFSFRSNVYGVERRVDVAFNKSDVTRGWKWKRAKHDGTRCFHLTRPEHRHRGERRENLWQFESYVIGWILFFFSSTYVSLTEGFFFFFYDDWDNFLIFENGQIISFSLSFLIVAYNIHLNAFEI